MKMMIMIMTLNENEITECIKNNIVVIVIIEIMTYTHKRLINVFASNI